MSIEKRPNSSSKPPEGENNLVVLVSLRRVLEIINMTPLLSVQKTMLAETLRKSFQGQEPVTEPQPIDNPSSPMEQQRIEPEGESGSDLLGKLEKIFKIDPDPDDPDDKEGRISRVIEAAEAYKGLAKNLAEAFKEDDELPEDLDDIQQGPEELTGNILERVEKALEDRNPDAELIVRTVLEFQGINFDDLSPLEQRMIFDDLERQGIDRPKED